MASFEDSLPLPDAGRSRSRSRSGGRSRDRPGSTPIVAAVAGGRSGGGGGSGDGEQQQDLALLVARVTRLEGTMSRVAAALLHASSALSDSAEHLETAAMVLAQAASPEFARQRQTNSTTASARAPSSAGLGARAQSGRPA